MSVWVRVATLCGALFLAACLSGCEIRGTVNVLSDQDLAVDVTMTGLNRGMCTSLTSELTELEVQRGIDSTGQRFCRVRGAVKAEDLTNVHLASAAEYYVLTVDAPGRLTSFPLSDLTVRFPGQVVESSHGTVSGSSVHLDDLAALAIGEPLRVVALRRAGPPGWLLAAGMGLLSGAIATFAAQRWWASRRARVRERTDAEAAAVEEPAVEGPEPIDSSTPAYERFFAPPAEPEQVWLGSAEDGTQTGLTARHPRQSPPDHSIWAPPS